MSVSVPSPLRQLLRRIIPREDSFLLVVAVFIGVVTAIAATLFHLLIDFIRRSLYLSVSPQQLYHGIGLPLLIAWPMLGGLAVGVISHIVFRAKEGHGVVDVMESVIKSSGFIKPIAALEKILTSAVSIGSGGSAGAEGPIVQIGAAISSGVGAVFRIGRAQMPLVIGCGSAAGISAIFNAPIGGLLFTLEVILQDFSLRTITPLVVAAVFANVTIQSFFHGTFQIFSIPPGLAANINGISWIEIPNYILLGIICGMLGALLIRMMQWHDTKFHNLPVPEIVRPAVGGALLGVLGVIYVIIFGHFLLKQDKPVPFAVYPLPAFFSDGYGFIQTLFTPEFYQTHRTGLLLGLLIFLIVAKLLGTCFTIASGGAGGIIAPSLFLGAVIGGILGMVLKLTLFEHLRPDVYALIAMGAVLSAVVHAPLASGLIVVELTGDYRLVLPAILASVLAVSVSRLINADSIYTMSLRKRGIRAGGASDLRSMNRMFVEQVPLESPVLIKTNDPLEHVIDLATDRGASNFVVTDDPGDYRGLLLAEDLQAALIDRAALPLLLAAELTRPLPIVSTSETLADVLDLFYRHDTSHLPVSHPDDAKKIIGLISRAALLRHYYRSVG